MISYVNSRIWVINLGWNFGRNWFVVLDFVNLLKSKLGVFKRHNEIIFFSLKNKVMSPQGCLWTN